MCGESENWPDLLHGDTATAELEVLAEQIALALLLADGLHLPPCVTYINTLGYL